MEALVTISIFFFSATLSCTVQPVRRATKKNRGIRQMREKSYFQSMEIIWIFIIVVFSFSFVFHHIWIRQISSFILRRLRFASLLKFKL